MNDAFLSEHPWLPRELGLSHSKMHRLRTVLVRTVQRLDVELAVAALAMLYLQRLIWLRAVNKGNRKVVAACCLLLAHKFAAPQPPAEGVRTEIMPGQHGLLPIEEEEEEEEEERNAAYLENYDIDPENHDGGKDPTAQTQAQAQT